MGGVNPYIKNNEAPRPTQAFTVTFTDEATGAKTVYRMDPANFPYGHIGRDGSLLTGQHRDRSGAEPIRERTAETGQAGDQDGRRQPSRRAPEHREH